MPFVIKEYSINLDRPRKWTDLIINFPKNAKILSCDYKDSLTFMDYQTLNVFAEVDLDEKEIYPRKFAIVATGFGLPNDDHYGWSFLKTVSTSTSSFHVYLKII